MNCLNKFDGTLHHQICNLTAPLNSMTACASKAGGSLCHQIIYSPVPLNLMVNLPPSNFMAARSIKFHGNLPYQIQMLSVPLNVLPPCCFIQYHIYCKEFESLPVSSQIDDRLRREVWGSNLSILTFISSNSYVGVVTCRVFVPVRINLARFLLMK